MDELFVTCPACLKKQRHLILRFKEKDLAIVKCSNCGCLHHAKTEKKESGVMLMISKGGIVTKVLKKFKKNKIFRAGDVLEHGSRRYEIRSIEDKEGGHSDKLRASEARNVYLVPYSKRLSLSVHQKDGSTAAYKIDRPKDDLLKLGDVVKIAKLRVEITRISSADGDVKKAKVSDILALTGR